MDFEEFREKLKEDLAERLFDRTGDDFEITSSSVNKLQNTRALPTGDCVPLEQHPQT